MEVELMVTKRDDDRRRRPTDDRVNIGQSASGRWTGRVLQLSSLLFYFEIIIIIKIIIIKMKNITSIKS